MKEQTIVNLNNELFTEAENILNSYGLDVKMVLNGYLEKIVQDGIKDSMKKSEYKQFIKEESLPRAAVRGILKGKTWISDDFDEPLDDLDDTP